MTSLILRLCAAMLLLAAPSFAQRLPGEDEAAIVEQPGSPKTVRPENQQVQCSRICGRKTCAKICSADGTTITIDTNNDGVAEATLDASGNWLVRSIRTKDLEADSARNRFRFFDNDAGGTATCANNCQDDGTFGHTMCILDTDTSAADHWVVCDGITQIADLSDDILAPFWMPFGAGSTATLSGFSADTCDCFVTTLPFNMNTLQSAGYEVTTSDANDVGTVGVFDMNGSRLFECNLVVTSTGVKTCNTTIGSPPRAKKGGAIVCVGADDAASPGFALRRASPQSLGGSRFSVACSAGAIPASIAVPSLTMDVNYVPPALTFGSMLAVGVSTSTTSSSSTTTTSSSTTTSTAAAGCSTVLADHFSSSFNDWWRQISGNPAAVTSNPVQRIDNATTAQICKVEVCLGKVSGNPTGTIWMEVWGDNPSCSGWFTTTGGSLGYCPSSIIGTASSTQSVNGIALLQGTPSGACGTTDNGQMFTFTWPDEASEPDVTAKFWLHLNKQGASNPDGDIRWAAITAGDFQDASHDAATLSTDRDSDFIFKVYKR